jgi:hypothetical protein
MLTSDRHRHLYLQPRAYCRDLGVQRMMCDPLQNIRLVPDARFQAISRDYPAWTSCVVHLMLPLVLHCSPPRAWKLCERSLSDGLPICAGERARPRRTTALT